MPSPANRNFGLARGPYGKIYFFGRTQNGFLMERILGRNFQDKFRFSSDSTQISNDVDFNPAAIASEGGRVFYLAMVSQDTGEGWVGTYTSDGQILWERGGAPFTSDPSILKFNDRIFFVAIGKDHNLSINGKNLMTHGLAGKNWEMASCMPHHVYRLRRFRSIPRLAIR